MPKKCGDIGWKTAGGEKFFILNFIPYPFLYFL